MNPAIEINTLESLIDQIINTVQKVIQSGEVLSDQLQGYIAKELIATEERISELKQLMQGNAADLMTPMPTPPTNPSPYPSSNINGFKYDYPNQKLLVKFQGKDIADNGPIYSYEGVPPFLFNILKQGAVAPKTSGKNKWHTWKKGVTPSHGAAMYHLIRDHYPYQRVS